MADIKAIESIKKGQEYREPASRAAREGGEGERAAMRADAPAPMAGGWRPGGKGGLVGGDKREGGGPIVVAHHLSS